MPIEDTWKELKKLQEEGKVKYLGISEATSDEIRRAHAVVPISACQIEVSGAFDLVYCNSSRPIVLPLDPRYQVKWNSRYVSRTRYRDCSV
jgi:hypothetical protein